MQAALKKFHSPDVLDLESYVPKEADNFGFLLQAMVGPADGKGEESFGIMVCTPKWLREKYGPSGILLGIHKLIVFEYDYNQLRSFVEDYLSHCIGETWNEVAQKVSLLGQWEFDGYQPHGR